MNIEWLQEEKVCLLYEKILDDSSISSLKEWNVDAYKERGVKLLRIEWKRITLQSAIKVNHANEKYAKGYLKDEDKGGKMKWKRKKRKQVREWLLKNEKGKGNLYSCEECSQIE